MHLYSIHIHLQIYIDNIYIYNIYIIYIYNIYIYIRVHTDYLPVASAMDVGEYLALKVKQTPASVRVNWKSSWLHGIPWHRQLITEK